MTERDAPEMTEIAERIARLSRLDLPDDARRIVADLQRLVSPAPPPAEPTAPGFDPSALDHILAIVGPGESRALLDRLGLDLTEARDGMDHAAGMRDASGLRRAAHNLVSLAGTAGAGGLQDLAMTLVDAAEAQDFDRVRATMPQALHLLDHLLVHLRHRAGQPGMATP